MDIRSVNSRFLELHPRLADEFRWAEGALRERLTSHISRGKVEIRLGLTRTESSLSQARVHPAGLASALRLAHEIRAEHPEIAPFSVNDLLRLPGVLAESQLTQEEWRALIHQLLSEALLAFDESRGAEGARLIAAIASRLDQMELLCEQAEKEIPESIASQQKKLSERLREAISTATEGEPLDAAQTAGLNDRIRQEAAVFGLRIDIAEEIDRLRSHLQAVRQTLASAPQKSGIGKRLDFLSQEMNREANTLGSKSASIELSRISIDLKLLIEQIREQVQNLA